MLYNVQQEMKSENYAEGEGEGEGHPRAGREGPEGEWRYSCTPFFLTSALDGGGWSTPRPSHFTTGNDPAPILREAGSAPGTVWTVGENLIRDSIPGPFTSWQVTIPTELSQVTRIMKNSK